MFIVLLINNFIPNYFIRYLRYFYLSIFRLQSFTEYGAQSLPGEASQFLDVVSPHSPDSPQCNSLR